MRKAKEKKPGDRRGTNPNSLANLKPVQPGEVRNKEGINRRRPYSDADLETSNARVPQIVLAKLNQALCRILKLRSNQEIIPAGSTWAEAISMRKHLKALIEGDLVVANQMRDGVEGMPISRTSFTDEEGKALPMAPPSFIINTAYPAKPQEAKPPASSNGDSNPPNKS